MFCLVYVEPVKGKGTTCVFPFTYKHRTYYQCTTVDKDRPWCATSKNYNKDKEYGYCTADGELSSLSCLDYKFKILANEYKAYCGCDSNII